MPWRLVGLLLLAAPLGAQVIILDSFWQGDEPFPDGLPYWTETFGEDLTLSTPPPEGGAAVLVVRNDGRQPVQPLDLTLDDVSLARGIGFLDRTMKTELNPANVRFSELPEADREKLLEAGEPVWYRFEPPLWQPGQAGEVRIRFRRNAAARARTLTIETDAGSVGTEFPSNDRGCTLDSIALEADRRTVTLVARTPVAWPRSKALALELDGRQVPGPRVCHDPRRGSAVLTAELAEPLELGSVHAWTVRCADGQRASAVVRAYPLEFCYGMWGARMARAGDVETARGYLQDLHDHGINVQMEQIGSEGVRDHLASDAGQAQMAELGLRRMVSDPGKGRTAAPFAYFLVDEPDAGDYRVNELPGELRVGSLAQSLVMRQHWIRERDAATPQLLNVNLTYKPDNWYLYGQLADILASDPYYQERLRSAYFDHPDRLPLYTRATYVYAVGSVARSAATPKPLHIILNAVCHIEDGRRFRFATPEEKRSEVLFALAAGAKGLSYWWYSPVPPFLGVGADEPEARALWAEIGRLGAEVRTLGPLLTRAAPLELAIRGPRRLWARALVAGPDTLILVAINEDHANDRLGTVVRPMNRATVSLTPPAWLTPRAAFRIGPGGCTAVPLMVEADVATLELGEMAIGHVAVLTADEGLQAELQRRYATEFGARVAALGAP